MSLSVFGYAPKHWRNGTTILGKTACWLIGEKNYEAVRVFKRTSYAEWWYLKQTNLHWLFVNKNDWANFFCILPKPDSSHGFPWKETQSRYGQFAEDTINSDGYANWYTDIWVSSAAIWSFWYYFWPRRWFNSFDLLSEDNKERLQYIDGIMAAGYESTLTYWWPIWQLILPPHEYQTYLNERFVYTGPDSKILGVCISVNRQNTCYDHFWQGVGYATEMD